MSLSVRADGSIRVNCNLGRSLREIERFVLSSMDFISRRRSRISELDLQYPRLKWVSGEKILYMGRELPLEVVWSWSLKARAKSLTGVGSGFEILAPLTSSLEDRRKAMGSYYKKLARQWLTARVNFFSGMMGVSPTAVSVRGQRTLWGSCTGVADISLNWKLMCCPVEVIDYVVVHELAHIRHRNHSVEFWDFVSRFDPKYQEHRKFLRKMEPAISRLFP